MVGIIRALYAFLDWVGWGYGPRPDSTQHEDPGSMLNRRQEILAGIYLGSKYYFKPMVLDEEGSGIQEALHARHGLDPLPEDFQEHQRITLHAAGDLIPYNEINPLVCRSLWDEIGEDFFGADLVVANLESPADFSKPYAPAPEVMLGDMYFNIDRPTWDVFNGGSRNKGFDLLSVANNHSLDQGLAGLEATMKFLQDQNVAWTGASLTGSAEDSVKVLERKGIRVGFVGATFSLNKSPWPVENTEQCNVIRMNQPKADWHPLIQQVQRARQQGADFVVAMLHGGGAYQAFPGSVFRNNVHRFCDESGVDLVVAGHAHHPQPIEKYVSEISGRSHWIVYSLGDFVAYDIFKWSHLSAFLRLELVKGSYRDPLNPGQRCQDTRITQLSLQPVYLESKRQGPKVASLQFKKVFRTGDGLSLKTGDTRAKQEFEEQKGFWERYVQPSLVEGS